MRKDLNYRLYSFKKKYYLNLIFKGSIYIISVLLSTFLFFNFLEYHFHSDSKIRAFFFFSYIIISIAVLYRWFLVHFIKLWIKKKQISDEVAANNIGEHLPNIKDKLLNLIQLRKIESKNSLLAATIDQRSDQMSVVQFNDVIHFKENVKYIKYLLLPFLIVALLGFFSPKSLTGPAGRIIHFQQEYIPQAPFNFIIKNDKLIAFRNEDFQLNLQLKGNELPENVYLISENRKVKLERTNLRSFIFNFEKIQESKMIRFEAAGFESKKYNINVVDRPNIKFFNISFAFPSYLNKNPEVLKNIGSFQMPIGTKVKWTYHTDNVNKISVKFNNNTEYNYPQIVGNQTFEFNSSLISSDEYTINLYNQYSQNKEMIKYNIEVIPDEFPKINLDQHKDTVLLKYIIFGGNISDDYGITDLNINYRIIKKEKSKNSKFNQIGIKIDKLKINQSYYFHWNLTELELQKGDRIEYYLRVRDNDGINGIKSTKTSLFTFEIPTTEMLRNDFKISSENTERQIDSTIDEAKKLNKELDNINRNLKGKKELSWQDQKEIENLIENRKKLEKEIKALQEQFNTEIEKRKKFDNDQNKEIKEKLEQLQKLMNELLDEETKKLYKELQDLLNKEQNKLDDLKDVINKLDKKEDNFERELERTLELFKKMKFELKLNENIQRTNELQKKQEEASKNSDTKSKDQESLQQEQQQLNEDFEKLESEIDEMQKINQNLERPQPIQNINEEKNEIEKLQNEAQKQLEQNKTKKAGKAQQGASQQLKKLGDKLKSMQSMMMQSSNNMSLNQLRDILDNLIKLSFEQENIMVEFKKVHQSDPRFLKLSQKQLKIREDAAIIQDSLISLSKNDFRVQSIVTRKVDEMNKYLDESMIAIKERRKGEAAGKQQFAMTSINDLALLLDDVMTQMMNAMGSGSGGQPQNVRIPSMSELQQQLGEKINKLKKSGKSGKQLSEELAKMAGEQERIRKMLNEMEEKMNNENGGDGQNSLKDIQNKMEQSELDLVNKRLTNQLINRQKEIVTRLLQAEKAQRERELDDKREAQKAREIRRNNLVNFEKYRRENEREIELLKTIPPKLNPYYKKEVNEYFKRLGS